MLGPITRVLCCVTLFSGLAAAQHVLAERHQLDDCSTGTEIPSSTCLPDAPSATQAQNARPFSALAAVTPTRRLSPAERPFVPLTPDQKFNRFLRSMYSPYTIFNGVYDATWDQATGGKRRYGGGFQGWGDRLGASVAATASRQFMGTFLFPTLLDQDPRYFAMYHGSVWKRFVHAASRTVLTKGDNGHTQFDVSTFLAIGASETLQNTWLPPGDRGFDQTVSRMVGSLQGTATSYLLREFSPDILRLFKRHCPKSLRRLEDKIPERVITGAPPGDD